MHTAECRKIVEERDAEIARLTEQAEQDREILATCTSDQFGLAIVRTCIGCQLDFAAESCSSHMKCPACRIKVAVDQYKRERDEAKEKLATLEAKVTRMVAWLDANAPEVWRNGLWDVLTPSQTQSMSALLEAVRKVLRLSNVEAKDHRDTLRWWAETVEAHDDWLDAVVEMEDAARNAGIGGER